MHGIKSRLKIFLIIFCVLTVFGTIGFTLMEGRSIIDSAYFVIATTGTVGYGDVHPATTWDKIFSIALIVMGVSTLLGIIANITGIMLAKRDLESRMGKLDRVSDVFL